MVDDPERIDTGAPENHSKIDLRRLSFTELERVSAEAQRLAANTYRETPDGFLCASGDLISIRCEDGIFKALPGQSLSIRVHTYLITHSDSVLALGSSSREEMVQAVRSMLEELGCRIIQ